MLSCQYYKLSLSLSLRFGQLLSSLLPRDHESETSIDLYSNETPPTPKATGGGGEGRRVVAQERRSKRLIRLRNLLLDVLMSHFITERNEFDAK